MPALVDGCAARTNYLVLAERGPGLAEILQLAYGGAAIIHIQPETSALMGEAVLVEVPPLATAPAAATARQPRRGRDCGGCAAIICSKSINSI